MEVAIFIILDIIPYLIGFSIAAPATLRVSLAARNTQFPGCNDNAEARERKFTLFLVPFTIIIGGEVMVLAAAAFINMEAAVIVFLAMVFTVYAAFTANFIQDISGFTKRSVHRNVYGFLTYRSVKTDHKARRMAITIMVYILGFVITGAAFLTESTIPVTTISTAAIYTMSLVFCKSISVRVVIITSFWCAGVILLLAAVDALASSTGHKTHSSELTSYLSRKALSFPPILALMPGILMGMAYRFDYQRYVDSLAAPPVVVLSDVPAPDKTHGPGFIIPRNIPGGFSKAYFVTALTAWTVVHITSLVALNKLGYVEEFARVVSLVGLEQPLMCAALIGFASYRGEPRTLWGYREDWFSKPINSGTRTPTN